MLIHPSVLRELETAPSGRPSSGPAVAIVTAGELDPLDLVRSGAGAFTAAFSFSSPGGRRVAGLGVSRRISAAGPDRFERLRDTIGTLDGPGAFLGFSFAPDGPRTPEWDGFAAAEIVVPAILAVADGAGSTELWVRPAPGAGIEPLLTALAGLERPGALVAPDPGRHAVESRPATSAWRDEVEDAIGAIHAGALEKVVLTRSVRITAETLPAPFDLVGHLSRAYPRCHAFGWQAGHAAFVGASPELLAEVRGRRVRSNPLAGSAPRGEGEADDRAFGEALTASHKDRLEHVLVVDDLARRLSAWCDELHVPSEPTLRRIATVQHLSTEIVGDLRPDRAAGLLEIVGELHPTAAVGGTPRDDALAFIDKVEGLDRGWYTGGIGWLEPNGDGEVALSLRCGLLRDETAHLYAGAGIVTDSDPEDELVETRLKFRPLLDLLTAT